jgi:hypothetical protein
MLESRGRRPLGLLVVGLLIYGVIVPQLATRVSSAAAPSLHCCTDYGVICSPNG